MNERIQLLAEQAGMTKGQELQIVASGVGVGRSVKMNKRILELAEQATKHYPATETSGEFSTFDKEKFAELIVRECSYRCYLTGEYQMAHELSDLYGFKFDFKKMMEEDDE